LHFVGYLQFQYAFGTQWTRHNLPTAIAFFCAYYFDNKKCLINRTTGLAAYIGLSVSPQTLLHNDFMKTIP
jgi:hypothetical protein